MNDGLNYHQRIYLGSLGLDDYPGEIQDALFSGINLVEVKNKDGEVVRVYLTNHQQDFDIGGRKYKFMLAHDVLGITNQFTTPENDQWQATEYGVKKEVLDKYIELGKQ
jgi:hypothetical protein